MRKSVTPCRKPASTSARPPQTRARGVFQIRSSPSEAWQRRHVHVFATGSCVERERERASSKYCYILQLPQPGYRERTTGNLEVKLKRKTKRENTGGCALRSQGETRTHPCCSSDSSRFGDIPCRLPGAPHSLCLWTSSGEEGRTREEAVQREEDYGGDAGIRSRESRRSLRPRHLLPAASDHSPHSVLGEWDRKIEVCWFLATEWLRRLPLINNFIICRVY